MSNEGNPRSCLIAVLNYFNIKINTMHYFLTGVLNSLR